MNFYKSIIVIFILLNLNSFIIGQCGIESPTVEDINCIENASYSFTLNFTISDSEIDSFDVFSNNQFIKRYSINQLPVVVQNDIYSGNEEDTLKIVDINSNCYKTVFVENPCECAIFDFKYTRIECNVDSFYILFDFKHLKTSDTFEFGYEEKYFGKFSFNDLPVVSGPFPNNDSIYELFLSDIDNVFCFASYPINSGECPQCEISHLKLISYECDENYNKNISFSFDHSNPGSKGYVILVNGEKYDTKEYANKMIIDTFFIREEFELNSMEVDCDSTLNIVIADVENNDCFTFGSFSSFCCELCEIGEIDIRDKECTSDSTFNFILDFDYARNRKDSFQLNIDDDMIKKYSLNDLPLHIRDYRISDSGKYDVLVCIDDGKCCSDLEFASPDCDYFDCNITGVLYSTTFDSISLYWVTINEILRNNTSDSFYIKGNGKNYGHFAYADLPIKLEAYNCNDSLELEYIFQDLEVDNCKYVIEPGIINCPHKVTTNDYLGEGNWEIYSDFNNIYIVSDELVFNNSKISIYTTIGSKVFDYVLKNGEHLFKKDISDFTSGIYIVRFQIGSRVFVKKIYINN